MDFHIAIKLKRHCLILQNKEQTQHVRKLTGIQNNNNNIINTHTHTHTQTAKNKLHFCFVLF
jgi:hypothetical protein